MALTRFHDPFDIVRHPQLEPEVKRAILASWGSNAHAMRLQAADTNRSVMPCGSLRSSRSD